MGCSKISAFAVLVAVLAVATRGAEAQSNTPSCGAKLAPCANYLNATNPPSSCCDPLREALTNEKTCLCNLYNSGSLTSFGINITQALLLPQHCNISSNLYACIKASGPGSSSSSVPPPATPGKDSNGVGRIAWTGMSSILLFWTSMTLV